MREDKDALMKMTHYAHYDTVKLSYLSVKKRDSNKHMQLFYSISYSTTRLSI